MSDIDLDRLGDLWRDQPDPEELARLERAAAEVRRRARWGHLFDAGAALVIAAVVMLLVATNPRPDTLAIGSGAILIMLVSHWRQRRLRQIELRELSAGTEDMLDASIERVQATLKRSRFSLFALPPALLLGLMFGNVVSRSGGAHILPEAISAPWIRLLWIALVAAAVAAGSLYFLRSVRAARRELERLQAMRESYRAEREYE